MENFILLISIFILWKYGPVYLQNKKNNTQKFTRPDIFSNISDWSDNSKNQEFPKIQIDPNLFTINGLDRFFDSVIELLKTGKTWEFVKNWLQNRKIELPIFYIGIAIVFFIFAELIFIFWVFIVITYFAVKQIKSHRDTHPGFGSSPSSSYVPEYSTYSANDYGSSDSIGLNYPGLTKEITIPILSQIGKFLWYLFLFLIITTYIVYKFFLPADIQKQIETEVLKYESVFRPGS